MKFSCEKNILMNSISLVSRATPSKSPIGSLEGILIETEGSTIKMTGYDLKKAIYTNFDANIDEIGKAVISSKLLGEMIRRLPDGIVFLTTDESSNTVNIKCGKSEYNFLSLDVSEYPEIPKIEEKNAVAIPQKLLKEMITRTLFAVSKEEVRPIFTGSLFDIDGDSLSLVSVDGYRLAKRTAKIENSNDENISFVVPGFALTDIERICDVVDDNVYISVGDKHISFTIDNTVLITRRLEGEFLNYKKSIPTDFRYEIKFERQELMASIDRVSLMLSEKSSNPIRVTFEEDRINCLCITPLGKAEDICICDGNGNDTVIGFNDRYLIDALKAAESNELKICLNTSSSPCIIKSADGTDVFTYMILPVRLQK